jgi:hypothetical protein
VICYTAFENVIIVKLIFKTAQNLQDLFRYKKPQFNVNYIKVSYEKCENQKAILTHSSGPQSMI